MVKKINIKPLVTVLMPVYNGEKYLKEAIGCILDQTFKDFEYLIIDDGSTDRSPQIIFGYKNRDKRIRVITHKKNRGLANSLNDGINQSKGEYIARMDQDDISLPNRLLEQITFMKRNRDITICGTWANAINESGNLLFQMKSPTGFLLKYNYWKPSPLIHPSVILRNKNIANFRYRAKHNRAEDYDLWLRLVNGDKKIFNLPRFLLQYRINNEGISKSGREEQRKVSWMVFKENVFREKITYLNYLSLVCLEFNMGFWERFEYLIQLSKKIKYPYWMILLDNGYYLFRKVVYRFIPKIRKY